MKIGRFTNYKKCNSFIDMKHVVNNGFLLKEFLFQIRYESRFNNEKERLFKVTCLNRIEAKELVERYIKEMNSSKYKMKKPKIHLLKSTERIVYNDFSK